MIKYLLISLLAVFSLTSAWSQSQSDLGKNASEAYKNAEKEINTVYQRVLKEYSADTVFIKKLKAAQRIWIQFRKAELDARFAAGGAEVYGSVFTSCYYNYSTQLTKERIKTLNAWLTGVPEGEVCAGSVKN